MQCFICWESLEEWLDIIAYQIWIENKLLAGDCLLWTLWWQPLAMRLFMDTSLELHAGVRLLLNFHVWSVSTFPVAAKLLSVWSFGIDTLQKIVMHIWLERG